MPATTIPAPHSTPSAIRKSVSSDRIVIELAAPADLEALAELEQICFASDRIALRSWRRLLSSESASVIVVRQGDGSARLRGAAVLLRRRTSSVARLYSLAVAPAQRGQGLAGRLLEAALQQARADGAAVLRLETRVDNYSAQQLFRRHGFAALDRRSAYYEDGATALRFQRSLWDSGQATPALALNAPFYGQTLDFTCGPCALLMAMAALDGSIVLDRTAEIRLWREATTVFMAAGHGGCGPFGLALAAAKRGFAVSVYAPGGQAMFVDSVRDARKKDVIALVEADFRASLARTDALIVDAPLTPRRLIEHLHEGGVPLVLISLWRLHGEKGPHWVAVTGFDGQVFRILDPIVTAAPGADPGISVSVEEFKRMARYGRRRHTAAVIVSKGPHCGF
ncbi:MAG: GNAT family N-acetyltransferase/peptidase C39 family protein [Paucibacter sp.]|nr:GNAT family N-acetyltransferase/peptidase C39 family protein [Roseateles sp.]